MCVCGSGMLICFVSALGSHEMGRHKLPIIFIIMLMHSIAHRGVQTRSDALATELHPIPEVQIVGYM